MWRGGGRGEKIRHPTGKPVEDSDYKELELGTRQVRLGVLEGFHGRCGDAVMVSETVGAHLGNQ